MFDFLTRWFSHKVQQQRCPGWKMVPATEVMDDGVHHEVHIKAPCTALVALDGNGNWSCSVCGCSGSRSVVRIGQGRC
jgi:hypothetical protein